MNIRKKRRFISILVIFLMVLSMISSVVGEDISEVGGKIDSSTVVKDQNERELGEEVTWSSENKENANANKEIGQGEEIEKGNKTKQSTSNTSSEAVNPLENKVGKVEPLKVESIEINGEMEVRVGNTIDLTAVVKDKDKEELKDEGVTWSSQDELIAVVDEKTGQVTGVKAGRVSITATSITNIETTQDIEITVEKIQVETTEEGSEIDSSEVAKHENKENIDEEEVVETVELSVENLSPENGASGVKAGREIRIKFNKPVESLDGTNDLLYTDLTVSIDGSKYDDIHDYYEEINEWYSLKIEDDDNGEATIGVFSWDNGEVIRLDENLYYNITIPTGVIKAKDSDEKLEVIEWAFDTIQQPLVVESLSPENGASGVKAGREIRIKFNKPVESLEGTNDLLYTDLTVSIDGSKYDDIHDYYEEINEWYSLKIEDDDNGEATIGVFSWDNGEVIRLDENLYYNITIPTGVIKAKDSDEKLEVIEWTFDTIIKPLKASSPIDGKTISPYDEIFMQMSKDVDKAYVDGLHIDLYEGDNDTPIKDGIGGDLAHLDGQDNKKIIFNLNAELQIGHSYKIKVSNPKVENDQDLIMISFKVEDIGEYGLKIKLNFKRRESTANGMQNFISASMNNGIVYSIRDNTAKGEEQDGIRIYAFDLYGHELWDKRINDISTTNASYMPVYGEDGTIYIQTYISDFSKKEFTTQLFALNQGDGNIKWKQEIDGKGLLKTKPIIVDDKIIMAYDKGLYGYDEDGGDEWNYKITNDGLNEDIDCYTIKQPPIKDKHGNIYIAVQGQNPSIDDGKIQVLDANGKVEWEYITSDGVLPPVIDSKGNIYVVDNTCTIRVLNSDSGEILTDHPLNGYKLRADHQYEYQIFSINIGNDDTVYTVINDFDDQGKLRKGNEIIAINPDGTEKYVYKNDEDHIGELVIDHEGYAYYEEVLKSGGALFVVSPYGNKAAEILPAGSTMSRYNSIYIYGNILIGAKYYSTNVIATKIERGISEQPSSIEIIEKDKELGLNLHESLAVAVRSRDGKVMIGEKLEWESLNKSIVEVDSEDGTLICKKTGRTEITVRIKGTNISDTTTVEVIEKPSIPVCIEILDEDGKAIDSELTIEYSIPYQFQVNVIDQYGEIMEDEEVIWFSIINYFPAIDNTGLLNPKAEGLHSIEVISSTDVRVTKEIKYKVEKKSSVYSDIFPKEAVMFLPSTMTVSAVNQYGEVINLKDIKWSSSNEYIATVDDKGKIVALAYGTTTITGTSGAITYTRELSVIPPFGYEWNVKGDKLRKYMGEGSNGDVYYVDERHKLVSLNSFSKTENWRLKIGKEAMYMEVCQDGNIYCLVRDQSLKYEIMSIEPNGTIKWEYEIQDFVGNIIENIEQASDGTVYFASWNTNNLSHLYAIDNDGNKKWQIGFEETISSFTLDNEDNIICVANDYEDSVVTKIRDESTEGIIIREDNFNNLFFGNGNIEVDIDGVVYGYFTKQGNKNKIGVCGIKDGNIESEFGIYGKGLVATPKIILDNTGRIYLILKYRENSYRFYVLDSKCEEIWKKELNDLTNTGYFLIPEGSFIVDDEGNICVVAVEYEKKDFNLTAVKSKVLRINPEGNVIQYVSYDKDKYGQFINTFLNKTKDSLYIIGIYGKNGDSLVKFNFENNQEIRIDEIKITADKESIIVNEILDLKADVYNQFGTIMYNERVTWSIQNEEIATVDDMGHVKGISTGRTNIVATSITNPQIEKVFPLIVVDANAHNISKDQIDKKTQSAINYYKKKGIPQGDWIAFGLSAAGENINKSPYLSDGRSYIDSLWNTISANDEFELITDYVKATLGILSGRYDPHNFGEMNLIEKIYGYGSLGQGNNAAVWALIALDAAEAEVPKDKGYFTQEFLIDYLLKHKDGAGWSVDGEDTDIDVTGMALYALAPYKDRENVKESVNETVEWLKKQQNEHGGFDCFGTDITNTESTAQIIMGLTALGIDPQDSAFIRGYGNPVSAMLNNQLSDGSFEHTKGTGSNNIATEQALQALAALKDFYKNGKSTIFYHIPYNKNIADVTVRIEGENKTLLPLTRVNIASGETTLYDAVTHALEEANIYHEGANNNITSINGETGWQWLVFKDKTLKTDSLPTNILYGEEEIILADESIINPVYTTMNVSTKELGVGKKFPVYVYGSNNQPIAGAEIIYSKADGLPVDTGIKTGVDGRAWVTIDEEGEFLISARGNAIIRPSAEEINLYNKKEITVDFRIEGPNSPILPHCMGKVYAGDYPNDILKKYKHDLTFDEGKNIIDAPKAIDGVEGNPYWGLYTRANDFDIPLKDGDYIIFTGNGTCTRTATIYIPKEVEVDKEFQVIIKDDYGNPIPNEEIFIDPVGISPLVSTGISTDENGRGKLVIDKTGSYWIGIYCKTKGLVRPESKEVFVKEEILQPEDQVTVKVTIEGYRGKKILNNYQVTTDIFDLQPYLRPGTGPTSKPTNDWYADKFHKPTVAHAVVRALEKKGINYDFQDYGWGLYFAMIGGYREKEINEKSGWMYEINGKLGPSVQDQYIKDGDRIRLWFTVGGWENPDLVGGDGLLDIINDEYATEEEILDALKKGVNKIKGNVNKLKSEEAAKKLVEDIEDMARAIGKAENRIDTEKCRKEVLRETIDLMKALKKSSQIVKDKKIKIQIDKAAGAVIETIMKLMDRQKDLKEIDNILDEIIKISGEIKNNIGKENSNKLELEIIEAVEGAINKSSIKEVKDRDISKEGDRVIVSVGTRLITESAEGLMERVKDLEEKLKNNNIEKNKRLERKITIKIPTRRIEEVQTILPSGILDSVAKAGINNIEIQTDVASFNITPNAFKDSIKEKEISLNAKILDEGEILKTSENTIPKGSIIVDLDAKIAGEKISAFEEPIEVSIPYKEKVSYEEQVTVYLLRDDRTIEAVGGIYDAETKTVKFITNHFSKYFAKEASMGFNDLGKVSWARNEIEAMAAKGVIKGRDKEKFDPNAKITRAEFATLMTRMLKYKGENKDIPFKDITNDKWYYEEVAAAYENGLMEGISHEEFNPEGNITGQEAITVIERILVQKGYKEASLEELKGYSQRDNIAEWAKPSIAFGIREGIINEDKKEYFIPNAKATRTQIAVMIYRLYHLIIK